MERMEFCCSVCRDQGRRKDGKPSPGGNGGVAQLGEHLPCKQGVMGSNPIISTKRREERRAKMEKIHRDNEMGS